MNDLKPILPDSGPSFGLTPEPATPALPVATQPEPPMAKRDFDESNVYYHLLNQVIDPETGVGIVDMGLIYHVEEHQGIVTVVMSLTSMGCPAGPQLTTDIDAILRMESTVKDVEIEVVWEPAWNPDMMNPEIRQMLFGGF